MILYEGKSGVVKQVGRYRLKFRPEPNHSRSNWEVSEFR
jgi:hypothetical protein